MRIGIDARLIIYRRGMGNYVYHLLHTLEELKTGHQIIAYVDNAGAVEAIPTSFTTRVLTPRLEPLWEQIRLPAAIRRDHLDVLHCTANTAPLFMTSSVPLLVTIHDVMYLHPPDVVGVSASRRQRLGRAYRRLIVPRVARRATHIMTDSEYSKRDMVAMLRLNPDDITVVPLAPASHFVVPGQSADGVRKVDALSVHEKFILAFGALDPRKNTERIIRAFAENPAVHQSVLLVITGLGSAEQKYFSAIARLAGIAERVRLLGFIDEDALVALYRRAEALLYPSLYEGFGFPVLEAMASSTPVITSNTTSIPEIARDAAIMVDPLDVHALSAALTRVLTDFTTRKELIRKGLDRSREYTWRRTAATVVGVYERFGRQPRHTLTPA